MQQNEPRLTSAAASRLGEINIVFQPMSNESPLLERGAFSTASPGQREQATLGGTHPSASPKTQLCRESPPGHSVSRRPMSSVSRTAASKLRPEGQSLLPPVCFLCVYVCEGNFIRTQAHLLT